MSRNGIIEYIDSKELVVGDLLHLNIGDIIRNDGLIIKSDNL